MGKRLNSVGNMKTTRSHKTAKRLAVKKEMLEKEKNKTLPFDSRVYESENYIS